GDGAIRVWDSAMLGAVATLTGHGDRVICLALAPGGRRLFAGVRNGSIVMWDLVAGTIERRMLGHDGSVESLDVSADGTRLVSPSGEFFATASSDRTVHLVRTAGCREIARLRGHTDNLRQVLFLPGGERVISFGLDGTVRTWRLADDHEVPALRGHGDAVVQVALDTAAGRLVSASAQYEHELRVWDLATRSPLARVEDDGGHSRAVVVLWPQGD